MNSDIKSGVITRHKFVYTDKDFSDYIEYMIREEAVMTDDLQHIALFSDCVFKMYHDDLEDFKHTKLFNADKSELNVNELKEVKDCFALAQENKSCMWQTVISFDNTWLEKNGLYDEETGALDVYKMHELTRKHMSVMLSSEGISDTTVWSASIHYNTKHTHIHIATVEPIPTRPQLNRKYIDQVKSSFKLSSILKAKSAVVHSIINSSKESTLINDIMRKQIIESKKTNSILHSENDALSDKFLNLYDLLPPNKQLWKYNNNAMKNYRQLIDEISKLYIDQYHRDDFSQLEIMLDNQEAKFKEAYGISKNVGSYKQNKLNDLYSRLGNAVLKELREYDYEHKKQFLKNKKNLRNAGLVKQLNGAHNRVLANKCVNDMKRYMNDDYEHFRNQYQFEQLQWDIEHS